MKKLWLFEENLLSGEPSLPNGKEVVRDFKCINREA